MSLDSKKKSFVKLSRAVFDSKEWNEKREFSKFEAFLDLIQSAEYKKEGSVIPYNGSKIKIERGQLFATLSYLQNRWNWSSRGKVDKYLKSLKNRNTLETEKRQQGNILTLVNYEVYNGRETDEKQKGNTLETNPRREEEKKEEYYYIINDKLKLTNEKYKKLLETYSPSEVDAKIYALENYDPKKRSKYKSMYLTLNRWLLDDRKKQEAKQAKKEAPKKEEYKYIRDHF
jgi:hypothetical protein